MISQDDLISILGEKIESIAMRKFMGLLSGSLQEDNSPFQNERYFYSHDDGLSLLVEDEKLSAVHLYCTGGAEGYKPYRGWIGNKLISHKVYPSELVALLGEPSRRGGGDKGFMGEKDLTWLRYDYPNYVIHYTFNVSNSCIEMVTVMDPAVAP